MLHGSVVIVDGCVQNKSEAGIASVSSTQRALLPPGVHAEGPPADTWSDATKPSKETREPGSRALESRTTVRNRRVLWGALSLVLIAAMAASYLLGETAEERHEARATSDASSTTELILAPLFKPKDLAEPVGHNRRKELLAAVGKRILQASPITALSVWSPDGTMVFSTAPGSVGDRLSGERDRLRRVMRGGVESVVEGSVFRTYVPLRVEPGSEAQGVVQLDRPYAPMLTAATRPWRLVTNGLALGLLIAGTLFSLTFRRRTPALATDGEGELEAPPDGGVAPEGARPAAAPRRTRGNPGPPPAYTLPGYREQVQAREAAERREEPRSQ